MNSEDLEIGESAEIAPGVLVERRCFLKTVALSFGAVALPGMAKLASKSDARLRASAARCAGLTRERPVLPRAARTCPGLHAVAHCVGL